MNIPRYRSVGRILGSLSLAAACSLPIVARSAEPYWDDIEFLASNRTFAEVDRDLTYSDDVALQDISYCDMSLASGWLERFECCQQQMAESGIVYNGDVVQFYRVSPAAESRPASNTAAKSISFLRSTAPSSACGRA
jgi:hypothetical protein